MASIYRESGIVHVHHSVQDVDSSSSSWFEEAVNDSMVSAFKVLAGVPWGESQAGFHCRCQILLHV